jgi:hypothetical protein
MCVGHVPWWAGGHARLATIVYICLAVCFGISTHLLPCAEGSRAFNGSAFALSFWSEWSMLHRGGLSMRNV